MMALYLIMRWSILIAFAVVMGLAFGEISTAMLVSGGWI